MKTRIRHDLQIATGVEGDILYRDPNGELINLGIGADGEVLTVVAGVPSWETSAVGIPLGDPRQVLRMNEAGNASEWQVDYYDAIVDAAGNGHYTDLNTAISTEPVGATIFVKSGTYTLSGDLSVKADQRIIGEQKEHTVINLAGGNDINISMGAGSSLENFTITSGLATTGTYSVISIAAVDVLIQNVVIMSIAGTATNIYGIELTAAGDNAILRDIKIGIILGTATLVRGIMVTNGATNVLLENIVVDGIISNSALTVDAACCGIYVHNGSASETIILSNIKIKNISGANVGSTVGSSPVLAGIFCAGSITVSNLSINGDITSTTDAAVVAAIHIGVGGFGHPVISGFQLFDIVSNGNIKVIYSDTDNVQISDGFIEKVSSTNEDIYGVYVDDGNTLNNFSNINIFDLTAAGSETGFFIHANASWNTIADCILRMQNPGPSGTGIQIDGDRNIVVGNSIQDCTLGVLISASADRTILGDNMILDNSTNLTNSGTNGATANNISA